MASYPAAQSGHLVPGGCLFSRHSTYLVQSFLGKGTFGKVVKCTRESDMKTVAIKMIKNEGQYRVQAAAEVSALLKLKSLDPDKCNIVRWYRTFIDMGHICLEFEHLDQSLFDFMYSRNSQPLPLKEIRPLVQQLATALYHLKSLSLIHADLKMENIMLVDHVREPYRVKVIDYSLGCDVSAARVGSYIQSRAYRSPEIILGLPFTEAIDMWSLGCVAAVLFLGTLLYNGSCEYEVMRYIVQTQGQPPDKLLNSGLKTRHYFLREINSTTGHWQLKTPEQVQRECMKTTDQRIENLRSLDDLLHVQVTNPMNSPDSVAEITDMHMFVELLKGMLQLDATERLTPYQVLEHHFISMDHIVHLFTTSSHVKSCFQLMDVCMKSQSSDGGTAVAGSLQQFSSKTSQLPPSSHSPDSPPPPHPHPPPPAQMSGPSLTHCIQKHPGTSNRKATSVKSRIKRKPDKSESGNATS